MMLEGSWVYVAFLLGDLHECTLQQMYHINGTAFWPLSSLPCPTDVVILLSSSLQNLLSSVKVSLESRRVQEL